MKHIGNPKGNIRNTGKLLIDLEQLKDKGDLQKFHEVMKPFYYATEVTEVRQVVR